MVVHSYFNPYNSWGDMCEFLFTPTVIISIKYVRHCACLWVLELMSNLGPLTRYVKLWVAHAPGMPGTFPRHRLQKKPLVRDPGMHHRTCVTHVPWCLSGLLTTGGGKNFPAFSFNVSGKRPITTCWIGIFKNSKYLGNVHYMTTCDTYRIYEAITPLRDVNS